MEITIKFLKSSPDGVRRLTTANWSGVCVVISRNQIDSALKSAELTRPGVYILAGPSEIHPESKPPRLVSNIYIGKSDELDKRLRQHHDSKDFWSTAFAFYRDGDDLHGGQIAQLEALLIEKARLAGNQVMMNKTMPKQHEQQRGSEDMKEFALQIETILKALGHDFFTAQNMPVPAIDERHIQHEQEPVKVPENLRTVVDQLKGMCLALPQTEFYATQVPDLRAKVIHEERSRVFAGIRFRKDAVLIHKPGEPFIRIDQNSTVDASVQEALRTWHDSALAHLKK